MNERIIRWRVKGGERHCTTGPAIVVSRHGVIVHEYFLFGVRFSKEEFLQLERDRPNKLDLAIRVIDFVVTRNQAGYIDAGLRVNMISPRLTIVAMEQDGVIDCMKKIVKRRCFKNRIDEICMLAKSAGS